MNKVKLLTIITLIFVCNTNAYCMRLSNIADRAEELIYGDEDINTRTLNVVLDKIESPETNSLLKNISLRNDDESLEVIKSIKNRLASKIEQLKENNFSNLHQRINTLLSLDLINLHPVAYSYLLEEIENQLF